MWDRLIGAKYVLGVSDNEWPCLPSWLRMLIKVVRLYLLADLWGRMSL